MTDPFENPGHSTGLDMEELAGHLTLIKPIKVEAGINTVNGVRDATVADVHVLDGPDAGTCHKGAFIWGKVLQGQLSSTLGTGRFQLGRIGKGIAKPGQSAPWRLDDPSDADRETARRYLKSPAYANAEAGAAPTVSASAPVSGVQSNGPVRPDSISETAWAAMDEGTRKAVASTMVGVNDPPF